MRLMDALAGKNQGRPPIWLMRQAGRYLPEYRALRAQHSLYDLFFTPKLAKEVTLQPLRRFPLDAAILFSDITAIAPALGFSLIFAEGPLVSPLARPHAWQQMQTNLALLDPIAESAHLVKQSIDVPLIGFCGGPYTIATYLSDQTEQWMKEDPEDFDAFLERITDVCILSLQKQIAAGADVVQIFDSWANQLQGIDFERYCLSKIRRIIRSIDKPVIVFMRGSAIRAKEIAALQPAAISVDWGRPLAEVRAEISLPLQGNLNPDLLFRPLEEIQNSATILLESMHKDPSFIVNLGHGIKPGTPLDAVTALTNVILKF